MYTKAAVRTTSATPLPMWDVEGSGMVPGPNLVSDFRDTEQLYGLVALYKVTLSLSAKTTS